MPTPTAHPTVLVLGANGRLGLALVRAFAAAGWVVRAQVRRPPRAPWPAGVTSVTAEALDLGALQPAAAGAAVVVNALNPDYTRWSSCWPPLAEASLALVRASGATLMLPGNVYNYGRSLPPVLDEASPFAPDHDKAAARVALEARLARAAAEEGLRSIVLRAGDFLGDAGTWVDMGLARGARRGRWAQMGPVDQAHAWAYLPDLARAFVAVAERRAALPPCATLHFAGHTLTGAEFEAAFNTAWQAAGGAALRRARFPWHWLRLGAWLPGRAGALPRAVLAMRYLWQRPHRLEGARLAALIGPEPHTPLSEVMRACVAALPDKLRPAGQAPAPATMAATATQAPSARPAPEAAPGR